MIFGSVCSGIEAASCAWRPLGWRAAFLSEIEAFPRAVLSHHYPATPLHGDFTTIQARNYEPIDLLVGGTPCQSFSVAGLRGGMADERGNLALEYLRLADRLRPRWLVWENVPGVLSSNGGRDFGSFLGGLVKLGYGFAYRVLDAQFFGLAQRRKRVFVVGYLGDWRRAAAVLFEPASLRWHPAPSREKGQSPARCLANGTGSSGGQRYDGESEDFVVANPLGAKRDGGWRGDLDNDTFVSTIAPALSKSNPYGDHESREGLLVAHSLRAEGFDASEDGTGRGTPLVPCYAIQERAVCENASAQPYTLAIRGRGDSHDLEYRQDGTSNALLTPNGGRGGIGVGAVAFQSKASSSQSMNPSSIAPGLDVGKSDGMACAVGAAVRRLMPVECERLQGFPDDYTLISVRGKPSADGPRYRALGNSMAVPVMRRIGSRIDAQHRAILAAEQVAA